MTKEEHAEVVQKVLREEREAAQADANRIAVAWAKEHAPTAQIGAVFDLAADMSKLAMHGINAGYQVGRQHVSQ